jgi:3-oxoacyl-[acyl-carrier protein] reductase
MRLSGKNALVTGAAKGIGKAIALKLADEGANVIINYASSDQAAQELVGIIEAKGVKAVAMKGDVSNAEQAENLVNQAILQFGSVDILINNAGITKDNLLLRMKEEDWDRVMEVNLKGTFLMTKLVGKTMLKKRYGKIVNITSIVGLMGNAGQANYAASKAGVIGLTKSVAKEFASRGINVNAVAPGFIKSDMTDSLNEEVVKNYLQNIPLGSLGEPEDVANAVVFLCSEESRYMTGQILSVDGGLYI